MTHPGGGRDAVQTAVREAAAQLAQAAANRADPDAAVSAPAEARTLVAYVLGIGPAELITASPPSPAQVTQLAELIWRRCGGVPVQHLTGEAWFRRVRLEVGPGVFIPRPETEVLTGWAIDWLRDTGLSAPVIAELGTGSGAIAKALADELPAARIHAVELAESALHWAARNLAGTGVDLRHGDLATAFTDLDGTVDLVIANPPYIPLEHWEGVPVQVRTFDPEIALFSGPDGLTAMRALAVTAYRLLRPGGVVVAEHAEAQAESAPAVFSDHGGFWGVRDHRDLADRPRFVTAHTAAGGAAR